VALNCSLATVRRRIADGELGAVKHGRVVWRVQTRNPAEHPVSRTRRIENDEEDVKDQLESVYKRRPQRCFSLVWRQKSQGGYSANDISVLSSAAVIHRNGG
jgi:hypothetical protein